MDLGDFRGSSEFEGRKALRRFQGIGVGVKVLYGAWSIQDRLNPRFLVPTVLL